MRHPRRNHSTPPVDKGLISQIASLIPDSVDLGDQRQVIAAVEPILGIQNDAVLEAATEVARRRRFVERTACALSLTAIAASAWVLSFVPARAASLPLPADDWQPIRVLGYSLAGFIVLVVIGLGIDVLVNFARQLRIAAELKNAPATYAHPQVTREDLAQ